MSKPTPKTNVKFDAIFENYVDQKSSTTRAISSIITVVSYLLILYTITFVWNNFLFLPQLDMLQALAIVIIIRLVFLKELFVSTMGVDKVKKDATDLIFPFAAIVACVAIVVFLNVALLLQ